jgi:hypothetical protein
MSWCSSQPFVASWRFQSCHPSISAGRLWASSVVVCYAMWNPALLPSFPS